MILQDINVKMVKANTKKNGSLLQVQMMSSPPTRPQPTEKKKRKCRETNVLPWEIISQRLFGNNMPPSL